MEAVAVFKAIVKKSRAIPDELIYENKAEPLPYHTLLAYPYPGAAGYPADAEHLRYELDYNTRPVPGGLPPSLRYNFKSPK